MCINKTKTLLSHSNALNIVCLLQRSECNLRFLVNEPGKPETEKQMLCLPSDM